MVRTRRPTRALLLIVLVGVARVPEGRAQSLPPLDEYHIRAFAVGDGLLAADVTGLAQTRDGYLYVAGGRGLARFDGHAFHRVALPGFRSSLIDWLHQDQHERLWIHSAENDLGYLEGGRVHVLPAAPVVLRGLSVTSDGAVWLGGPDGLIRVTPGAATPYTRFTTAHGLPGDSVTGVFDLPDARRVVVTTRRLARVEADAGRPGGLRFVPFGARYDLPLTAPQAAVRVDANGLWLALSDHVLRYQDELLTRYGADGAALNLEAFAWTAGRGAQLAPRFAGQIRVEAEYEGANQLPGHDLGHALRARDGTSWLAFRNQLDGRDYLVRHRAGRFEPVPLRRSLDFQTIKHLLEDHEGSLWVGTDRGLFQLSPRRVFALTARQGLTEGFTVPILQTRDGAVWVGTWGGGLHRFADGRLANRYAIAEGLPDDRVRALYEAADGSLWVGTRLGFAALREGRVILSERTDREVRAFAETRGAGPGAGASTLWIGTANRLLLRTSQGLVPHHADHWATRSIWALHTARDGALWIGSERGLFRLSGDTLRSFGEADGLRSSFVASIHEEADGTLWFGTYEHGLHRYRSGRFAAVTTREGLHHDGVWRVLEDGRGGVWMSSDQGIFRVDHARLHAVADAIERGERSTVRLAPLVFTEAEGMPNRESNRASPGGWRLQDGRLIFNNLAGVVVIDPVRAAGRPPPRTVLQGVLADGRPVPLPYTGIAEVPAGTRQLTFDFAALSFVAPEQNRYRYRLDGHDDAWVAGGTQRRAAYTRLPPRRYTFRVQGASGTSAWSEPGAVYAFSVQPLLWQTWWFRLAAVIGLASLVVAAYRYRVGRLLEMERLRLRIASDLHDDVGSNLSSIALLSEMLQGRAHLDDLEQRQLGRIHHAADETIGALRDIIWLVDPQHDDLTDLVGKMRGVAGDLLNGTVYVFDVTEPVAAHPLGTTFMRNALLIYKEALHNVAKHARAHRVTIEVVGDRGLFVLRIEDDGVGFAEAVVRPGHGLENMRRRARQSGGRIEIASVPRQGTRVTYTARMA